MTQSQTALMTTLTLALSTGSAMAAGFSAWNDHAAPLSFLFGNEIDGHQQSQLRRNGDLAGFLYVRFSGVVTADGYRVAEHVDCNAHSDCKVGWTMHGKRRDGVFLFHAPGDHPVFLIDRSEIPQPGAFAHFHRIGADAHSSGTGYLLQLVAVDKFCFIRLDAAHAEPDMTCQQNGGVAVVPGLDIATHLNAVTSAPEEM
jgi:hypothetical protein